MMRNSPSSTETASQQPPPLTLSFAVISVDQAALVGGKAASLGALMQQGLRVPEGFALTTFAFREHLRVNGLWPEIEEVLKRNAKPTAQIDEPQLASLRDRLL